MALAIAGRLIVSWSALSAFLHMTDEPRCLLCIPHTPGQLDPSANLVLEAERHLKSVPTRSGKLVT
jgi:hypothetical protein